MLLARSADPPPPSVSVKPNFALQNSTSHNIPATSVSAVPLPQVSKDSQEKDEEVAGDGFLDRIAVPTVVLDAPSVTHTMAARLSLSLLGHTLFLKSQVPFPVAQLLRMPGGASSPKVAKKREELLATFDTLSSHLQTTFVALSTAYAKFRAAKEKEAAITGDENSQKVSHASAIASAPQKGTAHLMFILGPSIGAARARVLVTVDGLEVKVWGERADTSLPQDSDAVSVKLDGDNENAFEDDEEDPEIDSDDNEDEDSVGYDEEESSEEADESDELESDRESELGSLPPASRSPQLSFRPLSAPLQQPPTSLIPSTSAPAPQLPAQTYAEEQATLRAAERLLSRTLMTAWADGGGDMASELAPTQTHVYLRAPRRFAHPAWLARQNLTRSLDGVLDAFLVDVGARGVKEGKKTKGVRTEGVWIGCKGESTFATMAAQRERQGREQECKVLEDEEEDEEIWWAWEGKIIGFADW
ncbi:hypothetical protein C2E23DRAFT_822570 [Lenzites betulinus]|nr:hypothetical protein C2E23DRAFT_822570 [Lenzites betulinus]